LRPHGALCLSQKQTHPDKFGTDAGKHCSDQGRIHGVLEKPEIQFSIPEAHFPSLHLAYAIIQIGRTAAFYLEPDRLGLPHRGHSSQFRLHERQR
jgi:hypothetical protein